MEPHAATPVLFGLALLVVAAKAGGVAAERLGQPSVLGELTVGIAVGNVLPLFFAAEGVAFARANPTLHVLAEIGVLVLLFEVGLEADLRAFVRVGRSSVLVAVLGVVVPFGLGWASARCLLPDSAGLVHVFIGATLTATSVGITARVLKDLGKTRTPEGQTVLGAAILDDVLGLIVLAVVSGLAGRATGAAASGEVALSIVAIVVKAVVFLVLAVVGGHYGSAALVRLAARSGHDEALLVLGLALCFTLAYVAERIGLAGIVGAFAAGLVLDPYGEGVRTDEQSALLTHLLGPIAQVFVPLFFVLMGIQVHLASLATPGTPVLGAALLVCAVLGKLATALGVLDRGVNRLAVAIGMIPRGEVGLIFAGIGTALLLDGQPLLSQSVYSAIVLMVLVTTLITPIGLRWALGEVSRSP